MIKVADRSKLWLFGQETERLSFRRLHEDDFDTWLSFCEDSEIMRYFAFSETASALEKCRQWFDKIAWRYENLKGGMNALIDTKSGKFVGQCGLLVHTVDDMEELEIGYSLMPESRGSGYALEAARKCRDFAFQHDFSDSLISIIHPDNVASQLVALKNGMKLSKQTTYNGMPVNVYRITKEEWENTLENKK
ncbi:GNAT family N-acetyltransferase [Fluviicola sp.]|uniref:GNAT family N-acetyltransferase n=1 Tax=Fluviicola sp. TaxID=1917219 RepID=UPI003D2C4CE9